MIELKLILLISIGCLAIFEWSGIVQYAQWVWYHPQPIKRWKPFDCGTCMTLWVSLGVFLYIDYHWWAILYACANYGISIIINKTFERITKK